MISYYIAMIYHNILKSSYQLKHFVYFLVFGQWFKGSLVPANTLLSSLLHVVFASFLFPVVFVSVFVFRISAFVSVS